MYKLAIVSIILALSGANAFWSQCGGSAYFYSIVSPDCDDYSCTKARGDLFTTSAMFSTPESHNSLKVRATAFVYGTNVRIDVNPPYDNVCNNLYDYYNEPSGCPTLPNEIYKWTLMLEFPETFPSLSQTQVQCKLLKNKISPKK